jgi:hypothetical protein
VVSVALTIAITIVMPPIPPATGGDEEKRGEEQDESHTYLLPNFLSLPPPKAGFFRYSLLYWEQGL